VTTNRTRK